MAMRPLGLDFARERRRVNGAGLLLVAIGAAGAIAVGMQLARTATERESLEARKTAAERAARRVTPARDAAIDKALAEELARANALLAQLAVPWETLFGELEAASAGGAVALTSLQPDAAGRQVRIAGEAKSFTALVDYVKRLEARAALAEVHLASHELKPANQSVAFVVNARWVRAP